MKDVLPVVMDDIRAAARRLDGIIVRTPLLESPLLNRRLGGRVLVKPEMLQVTGSFKYRGANNRILSIPDADRAKGVVAFSSGNHAQGVAAAAQRLGIPATIIMPHDAPVIKRRNTEAYGATVVAYDRHGESREEIGAKIAAETGATLVKPFDDPLVIAGQGTVGLEITEDLQRLGLTPDEALVCCGGGGLVAGTSIALTDAFPSLPVVAVEPAGWDDTAASLEKGERVKATGGSPLCDALLTPMPGEITFDINSRVLNRAVAVADDAVFEAMRTAFETLKLVVEPGGAVTLAALLSGAVPVRGRTVVIVMSGGNCDPEIMADALRPNR